MGPRSRAGGVAGATADARQQQADTRPPLRLLDVQPATFRLDQ